MKVNPKILNQLGLAMRAGKLLSGEENVLKAVRAGQARLVFVASDASENAKKKYRDKCNTYHVRLTEALGRAQMGESIGKDERVVLAVTDKGFVNMMLKCLEEPAEVENIE
ncbi:50S ribosomal protein L7ae [Paenibacillus swuensis]|uniref:50S ribosomal protein L7ae n=1 Tax=Paenibacillus swuensis TaxID=1178515 RepID=A0A172TKS6_9BACL|nr:ribosomal L7Ae/L30e/S12e/Gadd45 family protein [Paenibacillus swuensis]ANE47576.1 50S ribosomal protein L7ae [Paenibacillus swuensis]